MPGLEGLQSSLQNMLNELRLVCVVQLPLSYNYYGICVQVII